MKTKFSVIRPSGKVDYRYFMDHEKKQQQEKEITFYNRYTISYGDVLTYEDMENIMKHIDSSFTLDDITTKTIMIRIPPASGKTSTSQKDILEFGGKTILMTIEFDCIQKCEIKYNIF